tara:strand:- start:244 stop:696 length:453 start_codon:yes stop_codon:yes gene_type:complete
MQSLEESLNYCPDTGVFTWKLTSRNGGRVIKGRVAGSVGQNGYRTIVFMGVRFLAHRLAWFMYYRTAPRNHIDHIDRNRLNNKIENLRDVSRSVNMLNTDAKGYEVDSNTNKVYARLMVEGKRRHIGTFNCTTAAHVAYLIEKQKELTKW